MQVHHVTRQVEYRGDVVSLAEALVDFPAGGQVLLSGSTYQRVYGRLHILKFDDRMPKQAAKSLLVREAGMCRRPVALPLSIVSVCMLALS